ncbi:hypothetical protein LUU34_01538700 [Aix galericulata]|nr:hypothetical protein LUU34_01538700 [Aix galericulata]
MGGTPRGAGAESEGAAAMQCYRLAAASIPCLPALDGGVVDGAAGGRRGLAAAPRRRGAGRRFRARPEGGGGRSVRSGGARTRPRGTLGSPPVAAAPSSRPAEEPQPAAAVPAGVSGQRRRRHGRGARKDQALGRRLRENMGDPEGGRVGIAEGDHRGHPVQGEEEKTPRSPWTSSTGNDASPLCGC